jgi:hypothetical protein
MSANYFSGDGSNLSAINATSITTGTLTNARTTAASANGASTIVARDANGSFAANVGTFTTISGDGSGLTAINASNISSGTVANARTTAVSTNTANAIVLRDANGSFAANVGTFTTITGNHTSGSWTGSAIGAQYGGTGSANLTANNVILGNGANTVQVVAPGTANNVLTSNGTTWVSQAPTGGGGLTLTNDTTTNATYYPTLTTATSGSISTANTSSTKLFFNPSTGTLTSTVHTSNSDERLKENWADVASDFIEKLVKVKHGVFSRKDNGNREPGVGAQSFMSALPEAVVEGVDGYLSVNYGGAALVAAIELAKAVEDLRAEVKELKAKLANGA